MLRSHRHLLLLALAVGAAGCSFILSFEPEGQRCDEGGGCLGGYACGADLRCHPEKDGGSKPCQCGANERCSQVTQKCLPNTCQFLHCRVGQACSEEPGVPTCRDVIAPGLGHACVDDGQCAAGGANRVCYRGAVQIDSYGGVPRTGACIESCAASSGCTTAGAVRKIFSLAADGGSTCLCVPEDLFHPCTTDQACNDDGLVCTVFDHPEIGPATVCDLPESGALVGERCVSSTLAAGGKLCGNGLCVPPEPENGQPGVCGELCDPGDPDSGCAAPRQCALSEVAPAGAVRHVPLCLARASRCAECGPGGGSCGPDAPHCTRLQQQDRCLPACSPDAGGFPSCPGGFGCESLDAGYRCIPLTGSCP